MQISITYEQGRTVVTLEGAIKLKESGYDFFKQVRKLTSEDDTELVVIDMSGISYMDSTGIGGLVGYIQRLQEKGKRMALVNPQQTVLSLLTLSNLDKVIPIFPTKGEAFLKLGSAAGA
jgi:anti-sigma B factor antagonist